MLLVVFYFVVTFIDSATGRWFSNQDFILDYHTRFARSTHETQEVPLVVQDSGRPDYYSGGGVDIPYVPHKSGGYFLPVGHWPLPAYKPENLDPVFPMVHTFNTAFQIQDNTDRAVYGHLKVPLMNWGVWAIRGEITPQSANPELQYGHLLNPINNLNLSPEELVELHNDPEFRKRRRGRKLESVSDLPGSDTYLRYPTGVPFTPLRCKPPVCNPYVHTFATGTQIQSGQDYQVPGKLNFPIPAEGKDSKKPSLFFETEMENTFGGFQPTAFNYAHNLSPINPWTSVFKPMKDSGNPVAMSFLSQVIKPNRVPYDPPPLIGHNIFEDD